MHASSTVGRTAAEIRPTRTIRVGDRPRTIRVRPARRDTIRRAVAESLGRSR